jgi:hypothetical protein
MSTDLGERLNPSKIRTIGGAKLDRCECGGWKTFGARYCKRCTRRIRPCPVAPCRAMLFPGQMEHHVLVTHPEPIIQWDPETDFDPGGEHGGTAD